MKIYLEGQEKIHQALFQLARKTGNCEPAFRNIGEYLLRSMDQRFDAQKEPSGKRWRANSLATIERKKKRSNKILTDYGRLRRSITYNASRWRLAVGTNVAYGINHQFGVGVPKRPFLGLSDQESRVTLSILYDYLANTRTV